MESSAFKEAAIGAERVAISGFVLLCQHRLCSVALVASTFRKTPSAAWTARGLEDLFLRAMQGFHLAFEAVELTMKSILLLSS